MSDLKLTPVAGMRNDGDDTGYYIRTNEGGTCFMQDIQNLDVLDSGALQMRPGLRHVTAQRLRHIWQSPLHKDVFALDGGILVKVDLPDWTTTPLAVVGEGPLSFALLNNHVLISTASGFYRYDGVSAVPLCLPVPPQPAVSVSSGGSLTGGKYGLAVAWVRGTEVSPLSAMSQVDVPDNAALDVTLPLVFADGVTEVRLYATRPDGGELLEVGRYPVATAQVVIPLLPQLGEPARFQHMEPMPAGAYLGVWNGRLLSASTNVLRFSEAMAFHIHDPRHGFIQFPQRITFIAPVDGGIYVGQVDHVAHLQGDDPAQMVYRKLAVRPPVPGSAIVIQAQEAGEVSGGGRRTALWLSDNGYVMGTTDQASAVERHAGIMSGIGGSSGQTVEVGGKLLTVVQ